MPDDWALNPPIETLPQMLQARLMVSWFLGSAVFQARARAGPARTGWYRSTAFRQPRRCLPRPAGRPDPRREEDVTRVTADPVPGRSLVTKRAIRDLVRSATLSVYGVSGFTGGGPIGRLLERLGLAHPG